MTARFPACRGVVLLGLIGLAGCGEDARLAEHDVPSITVQTVSDQGVELGPGADPEEVVFVLLRAIRDDVMAGSDREARRQALLRQLAVCDPDYIYQLYTSTMGPRAVHGRDEWVYKKVNLWAPTLAHYVDSFDLDVEKAKKRMVSRPTSEREPWPGETVRVDLAAKDPDELPGADVVVRVRLHKHESGHWRVFHVGFGKTRPRTAAAAQPGSDSSDRADETSSNETVNSPASS
jgi:hypothetical protein